MMKTIFPAAVRLIGAIKRKALSGMLAALIAGSALAATPLHHYDFNGDTVRDLIGSVDGERKDAGLFNGVLITGAKCAECSAGYVEFPENIVPLSPPFSVAFFAAEYSLSGGYPSDGTMISQGGGLEIGFVNRNLRAGVPMPPDGEWHHYTLAAAAEETRLYIDGILADAFGPIAMGAEGSITRLGNYFDGMMEELWVFDGVLSPGEVADLAKQRRAFTYYEDGDGMVITGYTGIAGTVTIPESIGGKPVTGIAISAFRSYTNLTSVIVPKGVYVIGSDAFSDSPNLRSVYFLGDIPTTWLNGDPMEDFPSAFNRSQRVTVFYPVGAPHARSSFSDRPAGEWIPTDDLDHDGLNNLEEMLAGTDPVDASSLLTFERAAGPEDLAEADQGPIPAGEHALYFQSIPGTRYEILSSETFGGAWTTAATAFATTWQKRVLVDKPASAAFYRIRALPQE
jgi:hypothetical protein